MIRTYGCALFAMISMSPPPALAEDRVKPVDWPAVPPVAAQRPVTETFFGTTLTDPYRYMETFGDAETLAWMHAQAVFTRSILDTIPARAAYLHRLGELGKAFGWISSYTEAGGRAFYLERPAGADVPDLMVRDADGRTRKLVDVAALIAATGKPHAVSYLTPSKDGSRIAVGIAAGGSEQADLRVLDVDTGNRIAGPLADTRYYAHSFREDGRLAIQQFQMLKPGQPRSDAFLNQRTLVWDLKSDPVAVAGATASAGPEMRATEVAGLIFPRGSPTRSCRSKTVCGKSCGFTLPGRRTWERPTRSGVSWWTGTPALRATGCAGKRSIC